MFGVLLVGLGRLVGGLAIVAMMALSMVGALPVSAAPKVTVILTIDPRSFNEAHITSIGGVVKYQSKLANIIVVEVPEPAVNGLKNTPGVIDVSLDAEVRTMDTVPWGVDYVKAPSVWNTYGVTGNADLDGDGQGDIEVAVIDTGVDYNHPDLAGNLEWCVSTIGGSLTGNCYDGNGHGTHVIGTIAALLNGQGVVGVAPDVGIYAIKALDDQGRGTFSDIIAAVEAAILGPDGVLDADGDGLIAGDPDDDAPEVISMSLGGSSAPSQLRDIIAQAYSYGIVIVAAAGNEGASQPSYPAAYPEVIAVGAIDSSEQVPWWSNRYPEFVAPGVNILSTLPGGQYGTMSGTSMATPHVSAVVALIQAARAMNGLPLLPPGSEGDTSTSTVRGVLLNSAKDLGPAGYDSDYGYGAVMADSAVQLALGSGSQPPSQPGVVEVELLSNGGFDTDASGWRFYPGTYLDQAFYRSQALGANGVVEITGTIPRWQWSVEDYAFIGQDVTVPSNAVGSGTVTVTFYADSGRASTSLVVGIYDTQAGSWVWYDIVNAQQGSWQTISITVPDNVISSTSGGTYLFVVGLGVSTFTLWSSDWASLYIDQVSFTVTIQ